MDHILLILLVIAVLKFILFGVILLVVFKPDWRRFWRRSQELSSPICVYCKSHWTHAVDEGETRWESGDLTLVTTYQCEHCEMPFWHIERIPIGSVHGRRQP